MSIERIYHDPELVQFYDIENQWDADSEYCQNLAVNANSILDLGCGTGLLLAELSHGRSATGVDPAHAMLEVARNRLGGDRVQWIEGDARNLHLDQQFDLVFLTGHAFQVFLYAEDQRAVLQTIARHLSPNGQFIFDSRNPNVQEWSGWKPEDSRYTFPHPDLGDIEAWNDVSYDTSTKIATYETHYRVLATGKHLSSEAKILYTRKENLAEMIDEAGLVFDQWLGDWQGTEFTQQSKEIIPVGRLL
ncbi:MAG: class I SAM-dependent methyltransferase [Rhodospirillales bacterium]|nr:class I SAM-dependent methyltransferase [Rhodospirillales bacterium]